MFRIQTVNDISRQGLNRLPLGHHTVAGVNNIPVAEMSRRGMPVFNAPGADANAVKELVPTGMPLAARDADLAHDLVDVEAPVSEAVVRQIATIEGIVSVRVV